MSRLLACFARSLRLFVTEFAVVHDAAYRRSGQGSDFDKVEMSPERIRVSKADIDAAYDDVPADVVAAVRRTLA